MTLSHFSRLCCKYPAGEGLFSGVLDVHSEYFDDLVGHADVELGQSEQILVDGELLRQGQLKPVPPGDEEVDQHAGGQELEHLPEDALEHLLELDL